LPSDKIGPGAGRLVAYRNTAAGYGTAAAHVVSLRQAGVLYSFRPTGDNDHPFGIFRQMLIPIIGMAW
jgi:hypothetical protein